MGWSRAAGATVAAMACVVAACMPGPDKQFRLTAEELDLPPAGWKVVATTQVLPPGAGDEYITTYYVLLPPVGEADPVGELAEAREAKGFDKGSPVLWEEWSGLSDEGGAGVGSASKFIEADDDAHQDERFVTSASNSADSGGIVMALEAW